MKIGLFFGSFNPIHIGHLIIAEQIREAANLDEVWIIVSPYNPLKDQKNLAMADLRLQWVKQSISNNKYLKASDIEFTLPQPSYTFQTLEVLKKQSHQFHLIMGSDTFLSLPKWKNAADFINDYPIEIYKRSDVLASDLDAFPNATVHSFPILSISATTIRENIRTGKSAKYLVRDEILGDIIKYYK